MSRLLNVFLIALAGLPTGLLAQPGSPASGNCIDLGVPMGAPCKWDWLDPASASGHIGYLYTTGNFLRLERALAEAMTSPQRFTDGSTPAEAAYSAFRRMRIPPGFHEKQMARWQAAVPNSIYFPFMQARINYEAAWDARGTGYARGVSPEAWELFRIKLAEGEDALLGASPALKETPIWHRMLLATILDLPQSKSDAIAVFEAAIKRWPRDFSFYGLMLTRMVPKWGGSWKQVDAAIRGWSNRLASTERNSLYARLYVGLQGQAEHSDMEINWPLMKAGLEDLVALYPAVEHKNAAASYACLFRDKNAFGEAMQQLGKDVDAKHWLDGYSPQTCMRWAGV